MEDLVNKTFNENNKKIIKYITENNKKNIKFISDINKDNKENISDILSKFEYSLVLLENTKKILDKMQFGSYRRFKEEGLFRNIILEDEYYDLEQDVKKIKKMYNNFYNQLKHDGKRKKSKRKSKSIKKSNKTNVQKIISVDNVCHETYPCKHYVTFLNNLGEKDKKLFSWVEIMKMAKKLNYDLSHIKCST